MPYLISNNPDYSRHGLELIGTIDVSTNALRSRPQRSYIVDVLFGIYNVPVMKYM